jgi:hypothetical protein
VNGQQDALVRERDRVLESHAFPAFLGIGDIGEIGEIVVIAAPAIPRVDGTEVGGEEAVRAVAIAGE